MTVTYTIFVDVTVMLYLISYFLYTILGDLGLTPEAAERLALATEVTG